MAAAAMAVIMRLFILPPRTVRANDGKKLESGGGMKVTSQDVASGPFGAGRNLSVS